MRAEVILLACFICFLAHSSLAQLFVFNPQPANNTYVPGGNRNFTVNITGELNVSNAKLYIKAVDEVEWAIYTLTCTNTTPTEWFCLTTVPFAIVGSDTLELFYFYASDLAGNHATNGTEENPLRVVVDKNFPSVSFNWPVNGSYTKSDALVEVQITDSSSGVNESSVKYSLDELSWYSMEKTDDLFRGQLNVTSFTNNQSIRVWVRAADEVNNSVKVWVDAYVDDESPNITVLEPANGTAVDGVINVAAMLLDGYAGIDPSSVQFTIGSEIFSMNCEGDKFNYTCAKTLDTRKYEDGYHSIIFYASDSAGNSKQVSVRVFVSNEKPVVNIISPASDAYLAGIATVNATLINQLNFSLEGMELEVTKQGYSSGWLRMRKQGRSYLYYLNTTQLSDGVYELTIRALSNFSHPLNNSILIHIDNTPPQLVPSLQPYAKQTFYPSVVVLDNFGASTNVSFSILNYTKHMSCVTYAENKKLSCTGSFNTSLISDGKHAITFYARDLAGNKNSTSRLIGIDNDPPFLLYLRVTPFLTIGPTQSLVEATLDDAGSKVSNVTLILQLPNSTLVRKVMSTASPTWKTNVSLTDQGAYSFGLEAEDENGNKATLNGVGYAYVGQINCTNGICDSVENYCICPSDCAKIECKANETLDCSSGLPKCLPSSVKALVPANLTTTTTKVSSETQPFGWFRPGLPPLPFVGIAVGLLVLVAFLFGPKLVKLKAEKPENYLAEENELMLKLKSVKTLLLSARELSLEQAKENLTKAVEYLKDVEMLVPQKGSKELVEFNSRLGEAKEILSKSLEETDLQKLRESISRAEGVIADCEKILEGVREWK